MNIHAALHEACVALRKTIDTNEAKREAQLLLEHLLGVNHAWLIAHADEKIAKETYSQLKTLVQRRIAGEPIAYILGEREFYGLTLKVTPDTLIPRPDTETLVEAALALIPKSGPNTILDLGTGSGALALAIAAHRTQTEVIAVDASESALKIAQENANNLNICNVTFLLSNWFDALTNQTFDVVVSNPPYIEEKDPHLNQGDLRFEPISALASGHDGLNDIRQIIIDAKQHLRPNGWLLLEHGYNQATAVAALLKNAEFHAIQHVQDLAGIERVTLGQR